MISTTARAFGGNTAEVVALPSVETAHSLETVVGIGDLSEEVSLYSHLTGRSPSLASDVNSLQDPLPSVILVEGPYLDRPLIQRLLFSKNRGQATGIIWGRTRQELRKQILVSSSAATLSASPAFPMLNIVGPGIPLTPEALSMEETYDRFSKGVGILCLNAHGDGVAQGLEKGMALCIQGNPVRGEADPTRAPECVYTGFCHRARLEVDVARQSGKLVPPEALAARVVVNVGCHSAFVGTPQIGSEWSAFPRTVVNPRIGAVLAVAELSYLAIEPVQRELIGALTDGISVGQAISRLEEDPQISEAGFRMILFGDPRVRALPSDRPSAIRRRVTLPWKRTSTKPPSPVVTPFMAELEMMRLIAGVTNEETREQGLVTSKRLLEKLLLLEEAGVDARSIEGRPGQEARAALLEHLATTKVHLLNAWMPTGHVVQADEAIDCPNCGWPARNQRVRLPSGLLRSFVNCCSCSDVTDFQLPSALSVTFELPMCRIRGLETPRACSAGLFIVRAKASATYLLHWPSKHGQLEPSFALDTHRLPMGPARLYAVVVDGLSVHSAKVNVRRPENI